MEKKNCRPTPYKHCIEGLVPVFHFCMNITHHQYRIKLSSLMYWGHEHAHLNSCSTMFMPSISLMNSVHTCFCMGRVHTFCNYGKMLTHFRFMEIMWPLSSNAILIRVSLSEALSDPQHWLMGKGKDNN